MQSRTGVLVQRVDRSGIGSTMRQGRANVRLMVQEREDEDGRVTDKWWSEV